MHLKFNVVLCNSNSNKYGSNLLTVVKVVQGYLLLLIKYDKYSLFTIHLVHFPFVCLVPRPFSYCLMADIPFFISLWEPCINSGKTPEILVLGSVSGISHVSYCFISIFFMLIMSLNLNDDRLFIQTWQMMTDCLYKLRILNSWIWS